jgi:hypothetical protein
MTDPKRLAAEQLDPRESGTKCQNCRKRYRADWNIPDPLWKIVSHGGGLPLLGVPGDNLLCGVCIVKRIEYWLERTERFAAYEVQEL